jgi:hypothetical protein
LSRNVIFAMSEPPSRAVKSVTSRFRHILVVLLVIIGGGLALSFEGLQMLLLSCPLSLLTKETPGRQQQQQQRGRAGGGGGDRVGSARSSSSTMHRNKSSFSTATTPATTRDMVGEWLGQTWVPPYPWRLFGPTELLKLYQDKRVLWVGDSTGRRAFATMYAILQETSNSSSSSDNSGYVSGAHHVPTAAMDHPTIIDVNKQNTTELCTKWSNETVAAATLRNLPYPNLCRPVPGNNSRAGEFSYARATCYSSIENLLASELAGTTNITVDVDVIVVAVGIWELVHKADCDNLEKDKNTTTTAMQRLDRALEASARFASQNTGKIIIWRTAGYRLEPTIAPMNVLNNQIMDFIDNYANRSNHHHHNNNSSSNLMYVNWGGAVQPRSFGEDNIEGDIGAHYGKSDMVAETFIACVSETPCQLSCASWSFFLPLTLFVAFYSLLVRRSRRSSRSHPNDHQPAP